MKKFKITILPTIAFLLFVVSALYAKTTKDNDNMRWKLSWMSQLNGLTNRTKVATDLPGPYRGWGMDAYFDCDGDGNSEILFTDDTGRTTFIYENDGDNNYVFRWFFDLFAPDGSSLLTKSGRWSYAVDMDGDGADEFLNINQHPPGPAHLPALKIWKHKAGSAEFLPPADEWTVDWDGIPVGREDGVRLEYNGGAGDWDRDGKAEISVQYRQEPVYFFGMIQVTPPLTREAAQFNMEVLIKKNPYMTTADITPARIEGRDLDNDGFDEVFLLNRTTSAQCMYYLDCNGADNWTIHEWNPDMPRVIPDSVLIFGSHDFADVDGDGVYETVFSMAKQENAIDGVKNHNVLYVGRINPLDPAHMFSKADWVRLKTVEEMFGLPNTKLSYTTGSGYVGIGDADADGLPDVYFSLGEGVGSYLMDAEFVGNDWRNPNHYNYYKIVHCPVAAGLADTTVAILGGSNGRYGDGDKDGKPDIVHGNRRDGENRPALFVWEYQPAVQKTDNDNMRWKLSWMSQLNGLTNRTKVATDLPGPYRGWGMDAYFDCDGDGNSEILFTDDTGRTTFIYENDGDNNYVFRWFFDLFAPDGSSLLTKSGRWSYAVDMDGDGADEFLNINQHPPGPAHLPALKIWKHKAGSAEFLPPADEWTVDWDGIPVGREDGVRLEYNGGAGDWDRDGKAEISVQYRQEPVYFFGMIQVTPPLTREAAQFNMEVLIKKNPYMTTADITPARIEGRDLDNDGFDEVFLLNRTTSAQCMYYLDCNGADNWTIHEWNPDMPRVIPDSVLIFGSHDFADVDGDGVYETVFSMAKQENAIDGVKNHNVLYVGRINPLDPAHMFSKADWVRLKTVEEMFGLPNTKLSYTTGSGYVGIGDADADGLPDVYFSLGEGVGSYLMDAEFVGNDWRNPNHYNYYKIVHCPVTAGLADTTVAILGGSNGRYGDGDKDGKPDIVHGNRRDGENRPALFVWEYNAGASAVEGAERDNKLPADFVLNQNYPNPFNPTTTIAFSLEKAATVRLDVYNMSGQLIRTLLDAKRNIGAYQAIWDGKDAKGNQVSSGLYLYSLSVNSMRSVKKMTLMK